MTGDRRDRDGSGDGAQSVLRHVARVVHGLENGSWSASPVSGGANVATWRLEPQGRGPLIVRIDALQKPRPGQMRREATAMQAARSAGAPVPAVLAWSDGENGSPPWLAMEHVAGEAIPRRILSGAEYAGARALFAGDMAAAAVAIQRAAVESGALPAPDVLGDIEARYRALDVPRPAIELGLRWLRERGAPVLGEPSLVHGDFRLGNVLMRPDGLAAVIDWEFAHLGDPLEDLGFLTIRAWRFGGEPPVAGIAEYEELLSAYEAGIGRPVNLDALQWWRVLGTVRWAVGCLVQLGRYLDGSAPSLELLATGRKTAEQEYEILAMIRGERR